MALPKVFRLNNGHEIPAIGLGTFQAVPKVPLKEIVTSALALGYRHIDTAWQYRNETQIGEAIRESGLARNDLFLTSKLYSRWNTWHKPEDVEEALDHTLESLGVDYVDLYLMHFPHAYQIDENHNALRMPDGSGRPLMDVELSANYPSTWHAMEKLVESGKARAIGLSNFNVLKTKRILSTCRIRPAVNQVELHPLFPQNELVELYAREGILVAAHQPLGGDPVNSGRDGHNPTASPLQHPKVLHVVQQTGLTAAQVCLSWAVQRGIPVVAKTVKENRMAENLGLRRLPDDCFTMISNLHKEFGRVRFMDIRSRIGWDPFDENEDQPVPEKHI